MVRKHLSANSVFFQNVSFILATAQPGRDFQAMMYFSKGHGNRVESHRGILGMLRDPGGNSCSDGKMQSPADNPTLSDSTQVRF